MRERPTILCDSWYCTILILSLSCVSTLISTGCAQHEPPQQEYVSIGYIRWDLTNEQNEIRSLLGLHGIDVELWGSKTYSITVPKPEAKRALNLLSTNHLVLENTAILSRPVRVR